MKTTVDPETGFIVDENGEPFAQIGVTMPQFCPRGYDDCQSLAQIITGWHDDPEKRTFHCCGASDPSTRALEQDKFRVCFKNADIDECTDYDHRDIVDTVSVLMQALSLDTNIELNARDPIKPDARAALADKGERDG